MTTQTKAPSQGLLFSEPSYSETAVWCELTGGIDPAEWARICRKVGHLTPERFEAVQDFLDEDGKNLKKCKAPKSIRESIRYSPDSLFSRFKRLFCFSQEDFEHLPLVSVGKESLNA